MLLNIVYADRWGTSPFDVAFKGNEPHVDHIYPQYMLRSKMGMGSAEINDIGNLRLFGASDNIRKRGELPDSYFARLKKHGVPIEKHLLVSRFAADPQLLKFAPETFREFREARREEIWRSLKRTVAPEVAEHEAAAASRAGDEPQSILRLNAATATNCLFEGEHRRSAERFRAVRPEVGQPVPRC